VKLTDTHCHLNFGTYQGDLPEVINRAQEIGVKRILAPAIDINSCPDVLRIAEEHEIVYAAVGVHPNSALTWQNDSTEKLAKLVSHPKVLAIGEIGLDYYRERAPKDLQIEILQQQLEIAGETGLPVILHVRNKSDEDRSCIEDLLTILENWLEGNGLVKKDEKYIPGVIHSFSGNVQESKKALELGFYIGITGAVTFNKAEIMRAVVTETPEDKLLIETDGPFITPHPHRGKRNEPAHVRYIVDKISAVTSRVPEEVAAQTSNNAANLFGWE